MEELRSPGGLSGSDVESEPRIAPVPALPGESIAEPAHAIEPPSVPDADLAGQRADRTPGTGTGTGSRPSACASAAR